MALDIRPKLMILNFNVMQLKISWTLKLNHQTAIKTISTHPFIVWSTALFVVRFTSHAIEFLLKGKNPFFLVEAKQV